MNIIDSIHNQQSGQMVRSNALRKAAAKTKLPQLTQAETSLIQKKFTASKPVTHYTVNGNVQQQEFARGQNVDARV